jgi:hypothetical protein
MEEMPVLSDNAKQQILFAQLDIRTRTKRFQELVHRLATEAKADFEKVTINLDTLEFEPRPKG